MKRGLWIGILAAVMIAFLICEQIYVDTTINTLTEKAKELQTVITGTDKPRSLELITDLEKFWKAQEPILSSILDHNEIEDIAKQIVYVKSYIEADDLEGALIECNVLVHRAKAGALIFNFDFQNIL